MHLSRTIIAILSGIGIISTLMPWYSIDQGAIFGFGGIDAAMSFETGITAGVGYVSIILYLASAFIVVVGDRKQPLQPGFQKMGVLVTAGILVLYQIILISIYKIQNHVEPSYGLYISFAVSILLVPVQFFFKKDGSVGMPTKDEIEDSLEESADIIEDVVEDISDRFDKDDEDKKEKAEETSTESDAAEDQENSSEETEKPTE
ncbi:hypothetical protein K6119_14595 [Paracrocinitomix mangrovi]|uniref:hypothetical protein n=1 Tax=Paracrocinitomix mangrovi TaxID=2862509 RepID=UPI001C8E037A|nr:hypothetical protein [Paracrocinitomix mangrovi]UKN00961.1 hypothetical protein K6119_14595 [Paracrocinitomix mangrovi]